MSRRFDVEAFREELRKALAPKVADLLEELEQSGEVPPDLRAIVQKHIAEQPVRQTIRLIRRRRK